MSGSGAWKNEAGARRQAGSKAGRQAGSKAGGNAVRQASRQ